MLADEAPTPVTAIRIANKMDNIEAPSVIVKKRDYPPFGGCSNTFWRLLRF